MENPVYNIQCTYIIYNSVLIYLFYFCAYVLYRAQSVENLGLAVVALLTGIIVDVDGYYMVELFFCLLLSGKYYI